MTAQTFHSFSKKVVGTDFHSIFIIGNQYSPNQPFNLSEGWGWTAPISASPELIGIGTVQVTLQEKKQETWAP